MTFENVSTDPNADPAGLAPADPSQPDPAPSAPAPDPAATEGPAPADVTAAPSGTPAGQDPNQQTDTSSTPTDPTTGEPIDPVPHRGLVLDLLGRMNVAATNHLVTTVEGWFADFKDELNKL